MAVISGSGMNQGDVATYLSNVLTLVNELKSDVDALKKTVEAITTQMDADTGVTDTNYNSKYKKGGSDTDACPAVVAAANLSLTI